MFKYEGSHQGTRKALFWVNSGDFIDELKDLIKATKPFDMCTADNEYIAQTIKSFVIQTTITISEYKPRWRWSKAIGYYSYKNPTTINLNIYKQDRSISSITNTLIHEAIHMADYFDRHHSFGHGDNSPKGKQNTAPYAIGSLAASIVDGRVIDFNDNENYKIKERDNKWNYLTSLIGIIRKILSRIITIKGS